MCFIASILLIKNSDKKLRAIRFYLGFVVLVESACYYMAWVAKIYNGWVYDVSMLVEFGFGIWLLSNYINAKWNSTIILIAYLLFCSVYLFEVQKQWDIIKLHQLYMPISSHPKYYINFFDKANTMGSIIMICLCMLYYYSLFKQDEYVDLKKDPVFWIISGYFIFYTAGIGINTFFEKLVEVRRDHAISLRYILINGLNVVLYGCWIISFLCLKTKRNYTLS